MIEALLFTSTAYAFPDDPYPGPSKLKAGSLAQGWYGITPATELFGYEDLAKLTGIAFGKVINEGKPWLKFSNHNETCYIPQMPIRNNVRRILLTQAGLRTGNYELRYRGVIYTVGLLTMGSDGNTATSEWDRLLYNVHVSDPNGFNWPTRFTDAELGMNQEASGGNTDGNTNWGKDITGNEPGTTQAYRGWYNIRNVTYSASDSEVPTQGWRPILYAKGTYPFIEGQSEAMGNWPGSLLFNTGRGCVHGNHIYYYGGVETATKEFRRVNFETRVLETLSPTGPTNPPRKNSILVSDGKDVLYFLGGAANDAYGYNPTTNIVTRLPNMPLTPLTGGAVYLNGKVYICGVQSGTPTTNKGFLIAYDPVANTHTVLKAFAESGDCSDFTVMVYQGKVSVIGGVVAGANNPGMYQYNPATNTWTTVALPGIPVGAAFVLGNNGELYAIAGSVNDQPIRYFEPRLNKWVLLGSLGSGIATNAWGVNYNQALYLFGGTQGYRIKIT
ncbi:TPA: hypothetical protein RG892_000268 [Pseudomonas aeruginosa]|nr:hypothetical protein [Pseudomonas aeruginosa]